MCGSRTKHVSNKEEKDIGFFARMRDCNQVHIEMFQGPIPDPRVDDWALNVGQQGYVCIYFHFAIKVGITFFFFFYQQDKRSVYMCK